MHDITKRFLWWFSKTNHVTICSLVWVDFLLIPVWYSTSGRVGVDKVFMKATEAGLQCICQNPSMISNDGYLDMADAHSNCGFLEMIRKCFVKFGPDVSTMKTKASKAGNLTVEWSLRGTAEALVQSEHVNVNKTQWEEEGNISLTGSSVGTAAMCRRRGSCPRCTADAWWNVLPLLPSCAHLQAVLCVPIAAGFLGQALGPLVWQWAHRQREGGSLREGWREGEEGEEGEGVILGWTIGITLSSLLSLSLQL